MNPAWSDMASDGDQPGGFGRFVRSHHAELTRYLRRRVSNRADLNDFTQECYSRLLRYREGYSESSLRKLLYRIANNLLADRWRNDPTQLGASHVPYESMQLADGAAAQEEIVDRRQRLVQLKRVIENLPPKCQAVFLLSRMDGLSHPEIARQLGISIKSVEKHITKALAACRAGIGETER